MPLLSGNETHDNSDQRTTKEAARPRPGMPISRPADCDAPAHGFCRAVLYEPQLQETRQKPREFVIAWDYKLHAVTRSALLYMCNHTASIEGAVS